jgi:hypothetical protein
MSGSDDAERVHGYRFPHHQPGRMTPRPTGTLEEIYARIDASSPAARLGEDLDRVERALLRLEQAVREALEAEQPKPERGPR